jgi:hypothetical protein
MAGRGFLNDHINPGDQDRGRPFPSVGTLSEKNCVSIDNFILYVTKLPNYRLFEKLYNSRLESAIIKLRDDMTRNARSNQYTEEEVKIINDIKGIILSEFQIDEDGNSYQDGRTKMICPNLIRIIEGGKNRRRTTKRKRRTYSRKSKKTSRARYRKRN